MRRRLSIATIALLAIPIAVFAQRGEDQEAVDAAMTSLDEYMAAFNSRDPVAWAATLNYPHVRIASSNVRVWQNAQEYADYMDFDAFAQRYGWDHSEWDAREVVQAGPDKVHVAVTFSRYDKDGNKIATFDSFYVMTNKDGHWGTQARSSFAP